jgi:ATP-dependent helicase HrpA
MSEITQQKPHPQRLNLDHLLLADRGRLIGLDKKRRELLRAKKPVEQIDAQFAEIEALALTRAATRRAAHVTIATPTFDDALPIAERRAEIAKLIRDNQVVILCGETGSGKTTQLPKICLELGRGINGMIGCTQPRRIAARTLASRLAQELKVPRDTAVGFKIRFNDKTNDETFVKVMTDGIMLAETHSDRNLWAYDTIIIDEAHERSLNIDFLLGYLKQLLPKRPDLKIIVTSATIDPTRFSTHFNNAPIIEVSGRTYPVEVRYRPEHFLDDSDDAVDIEDAVTHAVDELFRETHEGDVLVFLPGEREIRDTADALRKNTAHQHTEVLPLFSRLSNAEQDRIFAPSHRRRIVLATNVAETSLTVPGIRYVVDTGVARVNRYSARQKIDMLQIEPISQASAKQRAGRCGRVAAGICIRLYAPDDHDARPAFTTPEILRTSLASVILRMKSLGLGEVANFPFVEPPSPRMIEDGYRQLFELGAVDEAKNITPLGWKLAKFPVDPAIARMMVAAEKEACLSEVIIIAAALTVQDPRDRPMDKQEQFIAAHEKFAHPQSEFLAFVNLWNFFIEANKNRQSHRKLDQLLRENFLSPVRMREWRDVHSQLTELCVSLSMQISDKPARYENVHRALLTGLITNVGTKSLDGNDYNAPRALKFNLPKRIREIAAAKKERMKWIMAAELTETTRVYARTIATIEPEWIEQLANHLVTRSHYDPHWERKSGQVVAFETVSLYGLVINARRRVHYGAINPIEAREIFIRQGLVAGEVETNAKFLRANLRLIEEIEDIEAKARRQDVLIDDNDMFRLYDAIIPPEIVNMAGFERWRKDKEKSAPDALTFTRQQLMRHGADDITIDLFPKTLKHKGAEYPLQYRFEPTHPLDGVTITLPVSVINQVNPARFEWLTMGMLREKSQAFFKTLPQRFRSALVPLPDTVTAFITFVTAKPGMNDLSAADEPLLDAMTRFLQREKGMDIPKDAWDVSPEAGRVVTHLYMNFRVVDEDNKELAMSRDFAQLKAQFADASKTVFSTLHRNHLEQEGLTAWPTDLIDLPETINFEREQGKTRIRYDGFPAFVDKGSTVAIAIFDEHLQAKMAQTQGLVRLFMFGATEHVKTCERGIKVSPVAAFQYSAFFSEAKNHAQEALRQEILFAAVRSTFVDGDVADIRTLALFQERLALGKSQLNARTIALTNAIDEALTIVADIRKLVEARYIKGWEHIGEDIDAQLAQLFRPRFLRETPSSQLLHYPRYLKAIALRINKAQAGAMERDLENFKQIRPLWQCYLRHANQLEPALQDYRWTLEELRVSLFAQELRTPMPVSVKRVAKMWETLEKVL